VRVLLADGDASRRASVRALLEGEFPCAEAATAEDLLLFLDDHAPGLTLFDPALPGAGGAEAVARVRELHPDELVLLLADDPSIALCRAAMRAGAHDCLDRAHLAPGALRTACEAAARRAAADADARRRGRTDGRAAVRRHEREAAARLASAATEAAWAAVDAQLRRRWAGLYLAAAARPAGDGERARAVADLVAETAVEGDPAALWLALHVHAVAGSGGGPDAEAVDRAREVLVEGLAALAARSRAAR
jgi:DNA-binding NarL/FixJ family response regulator